jgi:hypothetical protein
MKPAPACDATRPDIHDQAHDNSHDKARADAEALTDRVLHALARVNWPAHPGTLIESAEQSGAQHDVIDALRQLPDEAFGSFPEVSASIVATQLRAHDATRRGAATRA